MKIYWFDLETSGLDPARHGIISLAYQVEIDGEVKKEGELFSNCEGKEIEDKALAINLFKRSDVAGFPPPVTIYTGLTELFGSYVDKYNRNDKFYAGGFNVESFDMGFMRQLWKDNHDEYFGSWFHWRTVDPSTVIPFLRYAGYLPDFPDKANLFDTARYFGLVNQYTKRHDAF